MRMEWCSNGSGAKAQPSDSVPRMNARYAGSLFPGEPFECTLHSVYTNAINLQIPGKPLVYTLVTKPELMHPLAALVSDSGDRQTQFASLNLCPGQTGYFDGRSLSITSGLEISFATVYRVPQVDEVPPRLAFTLSALRDRVSEAGALLETLQIRQNTELRWFFRQRQVRFLPEEGTLRSGRFAAAAWAIVSAMAAQTPNTALCASLDLVGLGQGLTPSGDDFLCGLALALQMRAASTHTRIRVSSLAVDTWLWGLAAKLGTISSTIASPEELTGIVSKGFLYLASQGRFSTMLVQFVRAFADPAQDLEGVFEQLSHYGHSSGLDCATGFLFGMVAMDKGGN